MPATDIWILLFTVWIRSPTPHRILQYTYNVRGESIFALNIIEIGSYGEAMFPVIIVYSRCSAYLDSLKGQCHKIFCFRFFKRIIFPQAPQNNIRVTSNFFENSLRYSQVKVHHRYHDTGGNFATRINDNSDKFVTSTAWCCLYW